MVCSAEHVTCRNPKWLDERYSTLLGKYDFNILTFPVEIKYIEKFEATNIEFMNVYRPTLTEH